jgi:hypothetical protein
MSASNGGHKAAKQNREKRRVQKAIRHATKRGASQLRIAGMKAHLSAVMAGTRPPVNYDKAARREALEKLLKKKREQQSMAANPGLPKLVSHLQEAVSAANGA